MFNTKRNRAAGFRAHDPEIQFEMASLQAQTGRLL
jgi:hypothetical protein